MEKQVLSTIKIVDESTIKDMVYTIRGEKVMLDFDLARIYGYTTKAFNQQVKNNMEKFDDDFMFQISFAEFELISRSKILTSNMKVNNRGGRTYLPYAFTEQGIYMLMTVLKGELATQQSKALIRLFKAMKDYLLSTNIINKIDNLEKRVTNVETSLGVMMNSFKELEHIVIFDNQRIEADIAYQQIYSMAKQSIIIIDNYISIKTLKNLKVVNSNISITIYSDNVARNKIEEETLEDFIKDTGLNITIRPMNKKIHDRYIYIDYQTDHEILYHSGASSKDAGNGMTTIKRIDNSLSMYKEIIKELESVYKKNPAM